MVVQHNLRAMNSNRMLGLTTNVQAKSTEKLSSGYKINRAADDAAGLSISEKMRKQIRGLSQASLNAQDGISAVQTAEGALNEVQDMLQRMNELSVKAANGTMSEDDRSYIQNEIDQLVTEIDRVSETTKFNETYLLKGDGTVPFGADKKYADLGADKPITAKLSNADGKRITTSATTNTETGMTELNLGDLENVKAGDSIVIDGITYKFIAGNTAGAPKDEAASAAQTEIDIDIYKDGTGGAEVKRTAAELAAQIAKSVQEQTTARTAADVKKGDIASVSVMQNSEGDYILTAKSKLDATRATSVNAKYSSDNGIVVETTAGQTIHDGQIVSVGKVQQVGVMTKHGVLGGTEVNPAGANYDIDVSKYEGEATSFVWNNTDSVWKSNAKDENGNVLSYTTKELKDMGIGVLERNNSEAELQALDVATNGFVGGSALADGFTLSIAKGVKADSGDTALITDANINLDGLDLSKYENGDEIKVQINVSKGGTITISDVPVEEELKPLHFSLQVGADTTAENKISVDIDSMSAKGLGIDGLKVDGKDSTNADAAVDTIAAAIQKVSTQRSALGAVQNRLEHTIANLDNVVENTTAAESQIRDTDMATEMVKYSNNNILAQAGQAMLAQANQANQGVLSLLG